MHYLRIPPRLAGIDRNLTPALFFVLFASFAIPAPSYAGRAFSFGDGERGNTGLGVATYATASATPIVTPNFNGNAIKQVSAGSAYSLILGDDGAVYSFGWNFNGRTGLGLTDLESNTFSPTEIDMSSLVGETVAKVETGGTFSLLLTEDGDVFSFGDNSAGQAGVGTNVSEVPTASPINKTYIQNRAISQISAGSHHGLLLADDGSVFSFGRSTHGQTGLGTDNDVLIPTPINSSYFNGKTIVQVSAGNSYSLLLADDGTVFSFGDNGGGQTGLGTTNFDALFPTPIDTSNLTGKKIVQISAFDATSFLLADDGTVFSFGDNANGRAGLGSVIQTALVATPIDSTNLAGKKIVEVSAGDDHSLLLADDGTAFSFGRNEHWGQTGLGTTVGDTFIATPIDVSNLGSRTITQVSAGGLHSLLLTVPEPPSFALLGLVLGASCCFGGRNHN
ncbi:RCC1 domain-containing protein [Bythopirellula polymerisocia]|uniref:Regulator of chromosome condensation (RCC1) repeat protein n=1 Tax=Bythopirellula polymerisocia TaxID=2528003 RepID=A0A5C6CNL6_9BACT|nr:hypothetical protein [Bythopirellula polymerisocia]TWU26120.1 Regulator of chromosome condensation (RCC1) repeat protein [Bythopirellula polymerisocia]